MKPIRLTLSAFGPFVDEQTIDFRALGERRFFLIHGPTGSGKTTILDAICFALYGDTSGNERTGEQMRSQAAAADLPTVVTFDFSIGGKSYRVTRKPRQERPRKRGGGVTSEDPTACLWDRTNAAEADEGVPLAAQPGKVTGRIESLIGFRSDQFRQVVMLPQGKFRDLLSANSTQREAILQQLFQTQWYDRLQSALKENAKRIVGDGESIRERQAFLLRQAGVETEEALLARRVESENASCEASRKLEALRADDARAAALLESDRQLHARFAEHQAAERSLRQIEATADAIRAKRASVDAADRASRATADERLLADRERDLAARKTSLAAATEQDKAAQAQLATAKAQVQAAEKRAAERAQLSAEIARLDALRDRVRRLDEAAASVAHAEMARAQADAGRTAAGIAVQSADEQLRVAIEQQTAAVAKAATLEASRLAAEKTDVVLADRQKLASLDKAVAAAAAALPAVRQAVESARQQLLLAKADCADVQRAWIEGQGARLAKKLEPGAACPVCGSIEHPQPATHEGDVPSDDDLRKSQAAVDLQNAAVAEGDRDLRKAESDHQIAVDQANALRVRLGENAGVTVRSLQEKQKAWQSAVREARAAEASLEQHRLAVGNAVKARDAARQALQIVEKAYQDALIAESGARSALGECAKDIPESLNTLVKLDAEIASLRGQAATIDATLASAATAEREATALAEGSAARLASARSELAAAEAGKSEAALAFERKLIELGFGSPSELKAAKLLEVQIAGLRAEIAGHEASRAAAVANAERTAAAIKGAAVPDLQAIEATAAAARAALEAGIKQLNDSQRDIAQIDAWLRDLKAASDELAEIDRQYGLIGRLSEVAEGKNAAGLKFSRFVLGSLLDEVLIAATARLKIMSNGRYQLQRRRERTDSRTHGGLDLEVYDHHTGQPRPAATLSGGEGFLASLCLALGLADVVHSRAGGIGIETIFIDEGFGSLDSETLDEALKSLMEQFKGGRLIGVISHLTELWERIDTRLSIRQTSAGSVAEFHLS